MKNTYLALLAAGSVLTALSTAASANVIVAKPYYIVKGYKGATVKLADDISTDMNNAQPFVSNAASPYRLGFEGVSQYDGAAFGRNFVPPDTNGAVGGQQYMITTNGVYGIFDKYTGARQSVVSDVAFWAAAGQSGTSGDSRVLYNAQAGRWVAVAFGANAKDLQIAVSDTDNALGPWKSTRFEGFAGFGFGATADYPTLAIDNNAVYIGTNNFAPDTAGGANSFRGTTLNVIPLNSLFNAVGPTTANSKQFVQNYAPAATDAEAQAQDRGFAIQGVNSYDGNSQGKIVSGSLFYEDNVTYNVNGLSANSATGGTLDAIKYIGGRPFTTAAPGRQPNAVPDVDVNTTDTITNNNRLVDTLDERISSSVYEVNGRTYFVQTVARAGEDYSRVRAVVMDSKTNAILDERDIGAGTNYDYYQGSIAVNALGQVVIGYNRSGSNPLDGKIRVYAETFNTLNDGKLLVTSGPLLLKESLVDDYHNGSVKGQVGVGRQRWGDYSQVSVDPTDAHGFYLIGQFAREYNSPEDGHPGGTGGSRWSTWVASVAGTAEVPEPESWAMMLAGFGAIGGIVRRRRYALRVTYA